MACQTASRQKYESCHITIAHQAGFRDQLSQKTLIAFYWSDRNYYEDYDEVRYN